MATIVELDGVAPTIGEDVFLAPTAVLVGDVRVGDRCNIWFGTVLRGDVSHIEIGAGCSIQDAAVIHCASDLPTVIGADVVVRRHDLCMGSVLLRLPIASDNRICALPKSAERSAHISGISDIVPRCKPSHLAFRQRTPPWFLHGGTVAIFKRHAAPKRAIAFKIGGGVNG